MRATRGFLNDFVNRFAVELDDAWMFDRMLMTETASVDMDDDPAMLLQAMRNNLEKIYVPCDDSIRIGKWIYSLTRGFVAHRYQSPLDYVDICMCHAEKGALSKVPSLQHFTADTVPIFAVDGLPGSGKSALFHALKRVFPKPKVLTAEGNPPQKIGTVSAIWVSVNASFSLKNWMQETLRELGTDLSKCKGFNTVNAMTLPMFKALYRTGVGAIVVDELQFASGLTSARRVLGQLLAMREFGVPIFFFANTDLLLTIEKAPAQVAQRIPREKKTFMPLLRTDEAFRKILSAQLDLVPFGHTIDLSRESLNIYDMVAGLPRACARLIEIGAAESVPERRPLTLLDLTEAKRSPSFDSLRKHISILTALVPVDVKRYPELSSRGCGQNLGLLGSSSCIHTKSAFGQ